MEFKMIGSSQLLYRQVEEYIQQEIAIGHWKPGERLPGENDLSQLLGVSRVTLRNAIANLVNQGVLIRLHGKGTYVTSGTHHEHPYVMKSFTEICRQQGRVAGAQVVRAGLCEPDEDARKFLLIPQGEQGFVIERIRLVDNIPLLIEIVTFRNTYSYLKERDLCGSLYAMLLERNILLYQAEKTIGICNADSHQSKCLHVLEGSALLLNIAKVIDDKGEPLHTVWQASRADLPDIFKHYV